MFETEKIKLNKISVDDWEMYHIWRNDTQVMQSTSPYLDVYTKEDTQGFVNMIANQPTAKGYLIEYKETGKIVGIVSLMNIDYKNRSSEFIIDIGDKDMWGKGIGKDALKLILDYSFNELNLHRLYLQVFSFNEKAIGLYEKLGFRNEGRQREALYRFGKWHDIINMGILKEEYKINN